MLNGTYQTLKSYLFRKHAIGSDDIMTTVETLAIVSALCLSAVMATLFIPDADEFERADRFFFPNHTAVTYNDAYALQLPSVVILARGYNCICLSIIVFSGALFLIMSASEAGRRPVLGGSELHEIQRALHTNIWYKNFRFILFLLMGLQGLAIVLMILTAVDMINIRLPAYGKALNNPIFSGPENTSYASHWKEKDYTRWIIPILFMVILFLHLRVYLEADKRQLTVRMSELESRLDELKQLPLEARKSSKEGDYQSHRMSVTSFST